MEKIEIGNIGKAQGIKGEVKLNLLSNNTDKFNKIKTIYLDECAYKIEQIRDLVNGVFVKLEGVDSRNAAEMIKNKIVYADKADITVPKGSYLVSDVIGCEALVDGVCIGEISDILQNGAADIYVVKGSRNCMFPALKDVLLCVDVDNKRINLDKARFEQIVLYDEN